MNWKDLIKQFMILTLIGFIPCVILMYYVIGHQILRYDEIIVGYPVFHVYINRDGWILTTSLIVSSIGSVVSSIGVWILCLIFDLIFNLFKVILSSFHKMFETR